MKEKETYKPHLPADLYGQIEEIYDTFKDIQCEVTGIVSANNVTDTTAHLEDVLQSTEKATNTILDSATAIQELADSKCNDEDLKNQIAGFITNIYEACTFQDLTGQRIKRVLKNLGTLEERLAKLAESAKAYGSQAPEAGEEIAPEVLLNGPQLTAEAPTQAEIDKMFSSFN